MPGQLIGVLASGRGSNLQSILDACRNEYIPGRVAVVISDKQEAYALQRASSESIPAYYIDPVQFDSKEEYEKKIVEYFKEHGVKLICLAGYMRMVGQMLLKEYKNHILNIHPSLLPAFPGLDAQKQALDYGVRFSGCTVHFVDSGMDTGPIILQSVVTVHQEDSVEDLADRILEQEHEIYPRAVKLFLEEKIKICGQKVNILY
ncbi:MAG: phosphoribosylglycinamide formyltransferase [Clostridiales bacterium]|nr:phosphoribosylglycinamide formyltransferase [Clostridiales bacterium]MCF8021684.1 phosphoribosylglycinamide formyltransferase [Clostridiales bacterium]